MTTRRVFLGALAASPLIAQYVPKQSDRPEAPAGDEPGFKPIFDGKTLAGWSGDPKYWRVENGALTGEITPETVIKSNTFIIWQGGAPADFELKADYRITSAGNSGINYRSVVVPDPVTPANKFAMRGYQFDIDGGNRYTGQNYEEKGRLFHALRGQVTHIVGGQKPVLLSSLGVQEPLSASARSGISVSIDGPSYRSPYEALGMGYHATVQYTGGCAWIWWVVMWSDSTNFFIWDDWSGYYYEWTYDSSWDNETAGVGYGPITYSAASFGYNCFEGFISGNGSWTVNPQAPYASTLQLFEFPDLTSSLRADYCTPQTGCTDYHGKWLSRAGYTIMDQWYNVFYDGVPYIDEDVQFIDGEDCGDTFTTGGDYQYVQVYDWMTGCLSACPGNGSCWAFFSQDMYIDGYPVGRNWLTRECSGPTLNTPF